MIEVWKPIAGTLWFEVSNTGRVRSLTRTRQNGARQCTYKGRIYSLVVGNKYGHLQVVLPVESGRIKFWVAHLVAAAFIGPRPAGLLVLHKNGLGTDNRDCNLYYGTQVENMRDCELHGRALKGAAHPRAKLSESAVADIRTRLKCGETQQSIADLHGVTRSNIGVINQGRSWL